MTSLRVVMVSSSFYPSPGGAQRQALELSKALMRLGAGAVVLTRRLPGLPGAEDVEGIPVRRLPAPGRGFANSAAFMASVFSWLLAHAGSYDAVHAHLGGSPALAAALAGRLLHKPVLVKIGGGRGIGEIALSSRTFPGRLKLALFRLLKPRFIAVTEDLVIELKEHGLGGLPPVVIPNGVDTRRFKPAGAASAPEGPLRFLYVGRLAPEKRLGPFLEVFSRAAARGPRPARLTLVGEGPEERALRRLAARLAAEDKVEFKPPMAGIEEAYAGADVFVLPSMSEGLSNALLEAMSSGLAVLASRVGGTKEAVIDGQSGLLFEPGDPRELEAQLKRLLDDPGLAPRLGRRAREEAVARFDIDAVARRWLGLYRPAHK